MSKHTYEFVKKTKDINTSPILKKGMEAEITIKDLAHDVREWTRTKVEMQSLKAMTTAMMMNIEKNYPIVLKLTPEQLAAIAVYSQKKLQNEQASTNLKTLKKNYESYLGEFEDIKKSLGIKEDTELDVALVEFKKAKDVAGDTLRKAIKHETE